MQAAAESTSSARPFRLSTYLPAIWYGILLLLCFGPTLWAMFYQWQNDEDMGHGFFAPIVAGYVIWERRQSLFDGSTPGSRWGLLIVAWGALQLWIGNIGAELFLQRTAFLVTAAGIVVFYGGLATLRKLAFPLVLLLFMIPIPGILYKQITFPLQLLASRLAESLLQLFGFMVVREGNVLELVGQTLSVAEACSGLRSLHSLLFFSLSYAYLFDPRPSMRWYLLIGTVPVTIVANSARIFLTGLLGEYDQALAQGIYHTISGWSLFVLAIMMIIGLHKALDWILSRGAHPAPVLAHQ